MPSETGTAVATPNERFRHLALEWKNQSRHMSNLAKMTMLRPYQSIIRMGIQAVPLILAELRREPDHWFWALESITEANPVPPECRGKLMLMAQAWISWGQQNNLLDPD